MKDNLKLFGLIALFVTGIIGLSLELKILSRQSEEIYHYDTAEPCISHIEITGFESWNIFFETVMIDNHLSPTRDRIHSSFMHDKQTLTVDFKNKTIKRESSLSAHNYYTEPADLIGIANQCAQNKNNDLCALIEKSKNPACPL